MFNTLKTKILLILLVLPALAQAQILIPPSGSGTSGTIPSSDTLPVSCSTSSGNIYNKTGDDAGLYLCTDTDTWTLVTPAEAGEAPADGEYWVAAASGGLSAEVNLSALSTGLVVNTSGTPSAYAGTSCTNQLVRSLNASGAATCASVANADLAGSIAAAKLIGTDIDTVGTITTGVWTGTDIAFANIAQLAGLSVLGRSANSTGDLAAITAASDHQVLRRSGTSIAFGAVALAESNAVTGQLPLANGGLGANLSDPGADRVLFWDDSAGAMTWLTIGSGLTLTDTTLTADTPSLDASDIGAGTFSGSFVFDSEVATQDGINSSGDIRVGSGSTVIIGGRHFALVGSGPLSGGIRFRGGLFNTLPFGFAHGFEAVASTNTVSTEEPNAIYASDDVDGSTHTLPDDPGDIVSWLFVVRATQTSNSFSIAPSSGETLMFNGSSCASLSATVVGATAHIGVTTTGSGGVFTVFSTNDPTDWTCTP